MPFLRVLRDKRGHETTYLMHLFRDGGRSRSRVLYMFHSPQGLQVGGRPLDPDIRAELSRLYPDVPFDWRDLVAHQQVVEVGEPYRPRKRRKASDDEGEPVAADEAAAPEAAEAEAPDEDDEQPAGRAPAQAALPTVMGGSTPDEQVAWLAEWYPRVRDLIPQRFHDEVRRQALGALASRLDPSAWADDQARQEGLQAAAEAWGRLSRVFVRRRRRGRRRPGPRKDAPASEGFAPGKA